MINTNYEELYHYGVLGMKWGMRKAAKQGTTYQYKSHGQKKWERKLAKAKLKGRDTSKSARKLAIYKERDRARQDYASKTSVGDVILRRSLMGDAGANAYERSRAAGRSVKSSIIRGLIGNTLPGDIYNRRREYKDAEERVDARGKKK